MRNCKIDRRRYYHVVGLLVLAVVPAVADAQERILNQFPVVDPDSALEMLIDPDTRGRGAALIASAFEVKRQEGSTLHWGNYDEYTSGDRQRLLDGLKQVARGDIRGDKVNVEAASHRAFRILRVLAVDPNSSAAEAAEVPRRLLRIFHESSLRDSGVAAISTLSTVLYRWPDSAPEAVAVFRQLASQAYDQNEVLPTIALDALLNSCELGRDAIRELYEGGSAEHPEVRMRLYGLHQSGFPLRRADGSACGERSLLYP